MVTKLVCPDCGKRCREFNTAMRCKSRDKTPQKRCKQYRPGDRIVLPVAQIEFCHGANTLWVHAPDGSTLLRIKASGKIRATACDTSPVSHGDIMVDGDITVCIPEKSGSTSNKTKTKGG